MALTNSFSFNEVVVFGWKCVLDDRWPNIEFKVEMYRREMDLTDIIVVKFMTQQGVVTLDQKVHVPFYDSDPEKKLDYYKINDETLTRLMLILG